MREDKEELKGQLKEESEKNREELKQQLEEYKKEIRNRITETNQKVEKTDENLTQLRAEVIYKIIEVEEELSLIHI